MNVLSRYPWARWAAPAAVATIAIGVTVLSTRVTADAAASLSSRTAAQLLVDLQSAELSTGSGTVVQKADLGLPQLPTIGGAGSSELSSLVSGNHTLRVWYGGTGQVRVALLGTLGESDVIRNGRDLWTWSSDANTATHVLLPADAPKTTKDLKDVAGLELTPQQLADRALAAVDPTTTVSTDGTARVAGRDAYELVLAPKDGTSLVGQVRLAVDAAKHVPLRVQVYAKNATAPSLEVGFTQISFTRPAASHFTFTPPPGVTVTEHTAAELPVDAAKSAANPETPVVSGTGWTSVLQAQLPADANPNGATTSTGQAAKPADAGPFGELSRVLGVLPKASGTWGTGRLLHSSLFNVLLTDNGRVLAGAVPATELYRLAGQPLPTTSK